MKTVVIGTGNGASMDAIMAVYPRHKAFLDAFMAQGVVIGIGPLMGGGNLAIFRTREAAEAFARGDPFFTEGLVKEYKVQDWKDELLK